MSEQSMLLPEKTVDWLDNFSQSAAVDMGRRGGGHDAVSVAEQCLVCADVYDKEVANELKAAIKLHGYDAVLKEAAQHVRTL